MYFMVVLCHGSPTLILESNSPVGFHSNPNLAHVILIIWLISWTRLVTIGVGTKPKRENIQEQVWRPLFYHRKLVAANWGGRARGNDWSEISLTVLNTSNTWFPCVWCHSIRSVPAIIMCRPPLSSLLCLLHGLMLSHTGCVNTGSPILILD